MKFSEIVKLWRAHKKDYVKKSSYSSYTLLLENHLLPSFRDHETLTESEVQEYIQEKLTTGGLSQKTVKDTIIVFKMVLKYGKKLGHWEDIPLYDLVYPTDHTRQSIEVLNTTNYKKLIAYVKENFTFRNLGVLITMSTGMRIGEVCAIKWSDIDLDDGCIKVQRTIQRIYTIEEDVRKTELIIDSPKTKHSIRDIPLSPDLVKIFKPMFKIVNQDYYVLTNDVKPTEPRTYRTYYKELMKKAGIPEMKFHGLRHSFATAMINAKVDVKTVSVLLGHSNISTTFNLYVHPNMEQKKSAINQLFKNMK